MRKKMLLIALVAFLVLSIGCTRKEEKELTPISEEIIELAIDTMNEAEGILDSYVSVKEDKITIAIITDSDDKEYAKSIGEDAVKLFGDTVAMNSNLIGSTDGSYGEIYNEYWVNVGVGTSPDNIIVQGARAPSDKKELKIKW